MFDIKASIDDSKADEMRVWQKKHRRGKCWKASGGAVGGKWTFEMTPLSVGTVVKIKCSVCGESLDLSDYETW